MDMQIRMVGAGSAVVTRLIVDILVILFLALQLVGSFVGSLA